MGLTCPAEQNSCTLGNQISVYVDESSKAQNVSPQNASSATITFTKNEKGCNQGFKFKVSGDINLNNSDASPAKLSSTGKAYEIEIKSSEDN